jgi:hypothetical protein
VHDSERKIVRCICSLITTLTGSVDSNNRRLNHNIYVSCLINSATVSLNYSKELERILVNFFWSCQYIAMSFCQKWRHNHSLCFIVGSLWTFKNVQNAAIPHQLKISSMCNFLFISSFNNHCIGFVYTGQLVIFALKIPPIYMYITNWISLLKFSRESLTLSFTPFLFTPLSPFFFSLLNQ